MGIDSDGLRSDKETALESKTIIINGLPEGLIALDLRAILDAAGLGDNPDDTGITFPQQPASDLNLGHC